VPQRPSYIRFFADVMMSAGAPNSIAAATVCSIKHSAMPASARVRPMASLPPLSIALNTLLCRCQRGCA
jgi:hypothetical protein